MIWSLVGPMAAIALLAVPEAAGMWLAGWLLAYGVVVSLGHWLRKP